MTVASTTNRIKYSGDGATQIFAYTFKVFDSDELTVTLTDANNVETTQTETTHYSVSGAGTESGGNVTMVAAPEATETLTIKRVLPLLQEADYTVGGPFTADSHEDALDKIVMMLQAQDESLGRALKSQVSSTSTGIEIIGDMEASKTLVSNSAATGFILGPTVTEVENAETYAEAANAASLAALNAQTAAQNAATSANAAISTCNTATAFVNAATLTAQSSMNSATEASISANAASVSAWDAANSATEANVAANAASLSVQQANISANAASLSAWEGVNSATEASVSANAASLSAQTSAAQLPTIAGGDAHSVIRCNSGETAAEYASLLTYDTEFIPAGAFIAATTNGATLDTQELPVDLDNIDYAQFGQSVDEEAVLVHFAMPETYDRATLKVKPYWMPDYDTAIINGATVQWGFQTKALDSASKIDTNFSSPPAYITDFTENTATDTLYVGGASANIATGSADGDMISMRVTRNNTAGNSATTPVRLIGVRLQWKNTNETTAW